MTYGSAVAIGVLVGLGVGFAAEHLPTAPITRSLVAALVGSLLASLIVAGLWLLRPPPEAQILAISVGLVECLITLAVVLILAAAIHGLLGWIGMVSHRALILGVIGSLLGAAAAVSGVGLVHGVK